MYLPILSIRLAWFAADIVFQVKGMLDNEKKNIKFVCVGDRRVSVENTNKTIAGFSRIR
jgi:hypothetical protein